MAISENLFISILSLDAYNREHGQGIILGGSKIGNATIKDHDASGVTPSEYQAWQAASFYAVAYQMTDNSIDGLVEGEFIISYRGTENYGVTDGASDVYNGWPLAVGVTVAPRRRNGR